MCVFVEKNNSFVNHFFINYSRKNNTLKKMFFGFLEFSCFSLFFCVVKILFEKKLKNKIKFQRKIPKNWKLKTAHIACCNLDWWTNKIMVRWCATVQPSASSMPSKGEYGRCNVHEQPRSRKVHGEAEVTRLVYNVCERWQWLLPLVYLVRDFRHLSLSF